MPKKKIEVPEEERQALLAMDPEEKLGRLRYLDTEIANTRQTMKDQRNSGREYIAEMEARRQVLMDSVTQAPIPN
jgi:hypothetical protein